ncbi:MAG: hypothetical protein HZB38_11925, partial [Planctomycetes bacterium]|nr:hypothetical protein [Planctomycetota bacterium]
MLHIPSLAVRTAGFLLGAFALLSSAGVAQTPAVPPATSAPATQAADRPLREFLVIDSVGKGGRNPLHTDAIEAAIVAGRPVAPQAGDTVDLPDGSKKAWNTAAVGEDGSLSHDALRGGYAFARLNFDKEQIGLLNAAGHNMVYVNGEPHMGDPYSHGYAQVPIKLRRGENTFLFQVGRGSVRATISQPTADAIFLRGDVTCPDIEPDFTKVVRLAVPIANMTSGWLPASCEVWVNGRAAPAQSLGVLAPRAVGKRPIEIPLTTADFDGKEVEITLRLGGASADTMSLRLPVRREGVRKRTFISAIDGSVQYYAYRPGSAAPAGARPLLLSLHGASVEATGQAGSYGTQWIDVVAPTNLRPYGFDWEDWGRLDAMETLEAVLRDIPGVDPSRVYLSGHSMGGHGTWHLGVTFPDRFAAIGPSAGWISFWS